MEGGPFAQEGLVQGHPCAINRVPVDITTAKSYRRLPDNPRLFRTPTSSAVDSARAPKKAVRIDFPDSPQAELEPIIGCKTGVARGAQYAFSRNSLSPGHLLRPLLD
jgi:hypothetical protein